MQCIGAGLRNDIHNAAQSAPVLGAKTVVHDAELLHRFLWRSRALRTGRGIDVVGAVNRNLIAEVSHPGKGNPRHSNSVMVDPTLVRPVVTPGVNRAKSVNRRPLMGKPCICWVSITLLISVRVGSIAGVCDVTSRTSRRPCTVSVTSSVAVCPTLS